MKITIKEIAKLSGVGISTVSRVLNNAEGVSADTKKKVLRVVAETNYIPNNSARSLKLSRSKTIAVLVKGISNPLFGKMLATLENEIAFRGYKLLIQNVELLANEMDIAIGLTQDRNLCGVMIMGGYFSYTEEKFRQLQVPCVLLTVDANKDVDARLYSSVIIDDEKSGYEATRYLLDLGHEKIGFVYQNNVEKDTPNDRRFRGYIRAMEESGLPFSPSLIDHYGNHAGETGFRVGYTAMRNLITLNPDMTAVFAFSDVLAVGAAKGALSMGKRIPEDISIIGFDGVEIMEFYNPSLDTVYQPAEQMALGAIESLFHMMQSGEAQHLTFDTVLLKRGSCKSRR